MFALIKLKCYNVFAEVLEKTIKMNQVKSLLYLFVFLTLAHILKLETYTFWNVKISYTTTNTSFFCWNRVNIVIMYIFCHKKIFPYSFLLYITKLVVRKQSKVQRESVSCVSKMQSFLVLKVLLPLTIFMDLPMS